MAVGSKSQEEPVPALPEAEAGLDELSKPQTAVVLEGADFAKVAPFEKPPN